MGYFAVIVVSVCLPLMPSLSSYHLTRISLTLDVRYLFTAGSAKHRCCSLPLTWGISSQPLLLNLDMGFSSLLQFALIRGPDIPGSYAVLLFTTLVVPFHHQSRPQPVVFALALTLHSFWS